MEQKKVKFKFNCCDEKVDFDTVGRVEDIDGRAVGLYCRKHSKQKENLLKEKYFVETYKESDIYYKDGGFYPYWGCRYFFLTLDACKERVDNNHVAYFFPASYNTDKK